MEHTPTSLMPKALLIGLLLLIGPAGFSQKNDLLLLPDWRKGEWRTYGVTREETWSKDGAAFQESTTTLDMKWEVSALNIVAYDLDVSMNNMLMVHADGLDKDARKDLEEFETLRFRVSVNKKTGETTIASWEDASDMIEDTYKKLVKLYKKVDKERSAALAVELEPFVKAMLKEDQFKNYFSSIIDLLTFPMCRSYYLGDSLRSTVRQTVHLSPDSLIDVEAGRVAFIIEKDKATAQAAIGERRSVPAMKEDDGFVPEEGQAPKKEEPLVVMRSNMSVRYGLADQWPMSAESTTVTHVAGAGALQRDLRITVQQTGRSKR